MELNLSHQAAGYRQRRKQVSIWKKITMILASVVVFCTTYALILPAITMEQAAICGKEEHLHDETCYTVAPSVAVTQLFCDRDALALHSHDESCLNETGLPVCGYADFVLHRHDAVCYDGDGRLQCPLPEIEAHTHGAGCWQQPHIHSDGCYTSVQGELLCAMMEGEIHAHLEGCYTSRQVLICTQPEVVGHTHGDACRTVTSTLTCQLTEEEAHAHDDACLDENGALVCVRPVTTGHAHNDACYETTETMTCALPEQEGHTHGDGCYQTVYDLACALSDTEPHVHGNACYLWTPQLTCQERTAEDGAQPILICAQEEIVAHTHQDSCFADGVLTCGLTEVLTHVHSADDCYQIIIQDSQQQVLSCGMEEHSHEESCYPIEDTKNESFVGDGFIDIRYCGIAAHSHGQLCYDANGVQLCTMMVHEHDWRCDLLPSDPTAVETPEDWEADLPDLQGNMAADLIAVAESQLGYEQVEENYIIQGDEQLFYSRYADWWSYGNNPYGDWNAMFVDFCLDYAGITSVPLEPETATWPAMLEYYDQWQDNDGNFSPIPADLVFFDDDADGTAERVGIISATNAGENQMTVILENDGLVQSVSSYRLTDDNILGYGRIPGNESAAVDAAVTEDVQRVIDLIDVLPTYDEIYAQLDAYYEAGDEEGEEAYYTVVVQQVNDAYFAYSILSEEEKSAVTNANKLMELEPIWSAATLIDEIDSDTPTVVGTTGSNPVVSTSDFVKLNIYDYYGAANASNNGKTNINSLWNSNKKYPGFQWNGGAYLTSAGFSHSRVDNIDFGNSMITDFTYGSLGSSVSNGYSANRQMIGNKGGTINQVIGYTNQPIGYSSGTDYDALNHTLINGYPALSDGTSLSYLFSESTYASKKNTANIDGLFRQNQTTGEYWFDSRDNHAYYNNNKFTLYNQIITPNFILYPFGNFLPFNGITNGDKATQVSAIDCVVQGNSGKPGYMQTIINRLLEGSEDAAENQLISMLAQYRDNLSTSTTAAGSRYTLTVEEALVKYFSNSSEFGDDYDYEALFNSAEIQGLLDKLYNIDFDVKKNFLFGMDMEMNFMQPKDGITGPRNDQDMIFLFEGDDDVWVFIDDILFLDLTGIHRHVGGDIDFVKGEVNYYMMESYIDGTVNSTPYKTMTFAEILTDIGGIAEADLDKYLKYENGKYTTFLDYSAHNFKFYYMERGTGSSVCRINFNFPLLRENSITVTKENVPDNTNVDILGSPDYYFNIVPSAANAAKPLIGPDSVTGITEYRILDESGNEIGTGTVDKYGIFTLKAGQTAVFEGIEENSGGYYVQELIPDEDHYQYKDKVTINGFESRYNNLITWSERAWIVSTGLDTGSDGQMGPYGSKWYGYSSQNADASASRTFSFNAQNGVLTDKLGSLRIEKELIEVDDFVQLFAAEDPTFNMTVTLDGLKLPVGTAYTVHYSDDTTLNKMVTTAGIVTVPAGGYVVIDNILAGTEYTVTEQDAEEYNVEYKFPGEDGQTTTSSVKAQGIVDVNTEVVVRVINSDISVKGELTINKTVVNPDTVARDYKFRIVQVDANGAIISGGIDEIVTMDDVLTTGTAKFSLGYAEADIEKFPAVYYYRITEVNDKAEVQENNQIFLAEVTVTQADDTLNAQLTNLWACTVGENDTLVKGDTAPTILFQNTIVGSLTLSKTVVGTTPEAGFSFKIKLTEGTSDVPIPAECIHDVTIRNQDQDPVLSTWKFVNGETTINGFMDGEYIIIHDIPFGTAWIIEEINADGYVVTYKVNDGESQSGAHSTGSITVGSTEVVFTNSAMYELPETGGGGVAKILTCGGLLTIMPCLWLLRRQRYRGRRVNGG